MPPRSCRPSIRDPLVPVPYLAATQRRPAARSSSRPRRRAKPAILRSRPRKPPPCRPRPCKPPLWPRRTTKPRSHSMRPRIRLSRNPSAIKSSAVQPATLREQSAPDDADAKARDVLAISINRRAAASGSAKGRSLTYFIFTADKWVNGGYAADDVGPDFLNSCWRDAPKGRRAAGRNSHRDLALGNTPAPSALRVAAAFAAIATMSGLHCAGRLRP
jgi:hypothetical protein